MTKITIFKSCSRNQVLQEMGITMIVTTCACLPDNSGIILEQKQDMYK